MGASCSRTTLIGTIATPSRPPGGSLEQAGTEVTLERLNLLRQRRLRDPKLAGGDRKRARLRDLDEVRHVPQRHRGWCRQGL
jgi:hypothetical protein